MLTRYFVHSLHIIKQRAWFIRGTGNQIIQWIQLDDLLGTIRHLAIYIWNGSLVIFRPSHCEFPPIDYELAASIELGNLGRANLPEKSSSVWLMISHMLFVLFLRDI